MSIFFKTATDGKVKFIPRSEESIAGGKYLLNLLKNSEDGLDYPQRQVQDLSDFEMNNMATLDDYLNQGTEGTNLAMEEFKKTLGGNYDPKTSDYYKGYRDEMNTMKADSASGIRRQANKAGMLRSDPALRAIGDNSQKYDTMIGKELGGLYERERDRKTDAAKSANQIGQQKFSNLLSSQGMSAMPRQIEQEKLDAAYEEVLNELLAPYNVVAPIASDMMGHTREKWIVPGRTGKEQQAWFQDAQVFGALFAGGMM